MDTNIHECTGGAPNHIAIPPNHNVVGTCGSCGGPVISPMFVSGTASADEKCANCGKRAKPIIQSGWGPKREMILS